MNLDKDLRSVQEVRDLLKAAVQAQRILATLSQDQIDRIVAAMAQAARENAKRLGAMACEETGFGLVSDKEIKNRFAAETLYEAIRAEQTVGILRRDHEKKIIDIAVPVGVVAALVPSTNPTSTVIYKALICLKAGNPVIFSPHPSALNCIVETVNILRRAAEGAGAPAGSIGVITTPTMEATRELMSNRSTRLILATGGGAMVRAAYSSGTPAIGVGAGNGPAYIHKSADPALAVKRILGSKTFDNGTICASEQSIVITKEMEPAVTRELERQGAHILSPEQNQTLSKFILRPGGTMNPAIVGKSVSTLVKLAGLSGVPATARVLVARETGVGKDHPYSNEKLGLILAYYVEPDEDAVLRRCVELLEWEGVGHTFSIHAEDETVVNKFSAVIPASRVLVNTPSALGGIGATTCLFPALTLGCGTVGGSASSNNIGPWDLINIKRVAWGVREKDELFSAENIVPASSMDDKTLEELVRQMIHSLMK